MIKTLTKHGNSLALVIDKPILELLNIDAETQLKLTTDGKQLVITPAQAGEDRDAKLRGSLAKINARHSKALKKLAE